MYLYIIRNILHLYALIFTSLLGVSQHVHSMIHVRNDNSNTVRRQRMT